MYVLNMNRINPSSFVYSHLDIQLTRCVSQTSSSQPLWGTWLSAQPSLLGDSRVGNKALELIVL